MFACLPMPTHVPTLMSLSFEVVLANVSALSGDALATLPEHVQLGLFEGVLARGALNESILEVFVHAAATAATLAQRIEGLNLRPLPPRPTNSNVRWLGDNPSWY